MEHKRVWAIAAGCHALRYSGCHDLQRFTAAEMQACINGLYLNDRQELLADATHHATCSVSGGAIELVCHGHGNW